MSTKQKKVFLSVSFLLFFLFITQSSMPAQSANAKETLKQYISELQYKPNDTSLREKIINLVLTMKPKPQVPAEVVRLEGAAEYAIKNAKTESDFADAAATYEKALLLAPWLAFDYFNCGVAYEKAGKLKNAIESFNFYLLAAPNAQDATEVQKRIGGLEYAMEKTAKESSPEALAAKEKAQEEELARNLDGVRFVRMIQSLGFTYRQAFEISGEEIIFKEELLDIDRNRVISVDGFPQVGVWYERWSTRLEGLSATITFKSGETFLLSISKDGRSLTRSLYYKGEKQGTPDAVFRRE